jgi:hypothetical protein
MNQYSTGIKVVGNLGYSFRELEEGEDWTDLLSFNLSISGNYKKQSNILDSTLKQMSSFSWRPKPMKSSNSFSFLSPVNSATMRSLHKLFGDWWCNGDEKEDMERDENATSTLKP